MVTTITEWALLAQSYIIQLFSCFVKFFSTPAHFLSGTPGRIPALRRPHILVFSLPWNRPNHKRGPVYSVQSMRKGCAQRR